MKLFKAFSFLALLVIAVSCGKDGPTNPVYVDHSRNFELHVDYWNNDGISPNIVFDETNSSPEVKIDFKHTFGGVAIPPNLINVQIANVRILNDKNVNFEIEQIDAYEWRKDINDWKNDVEFIMDFDQVQDLEIVMVLDASASLGSDFNKVKAYARNFAQNVFEQIPNAKIGIVDFSDVQHVLVPTNKEQDIYDHIDNMQQGNFTMLYEAMNTGIDILQSSNADARAILTFTDGTDNISDPQFTPAFLLNKLSGGNNDELINSFTIGLEGNGGVDRAVLEGLAANGGVAEFPENMNQLQKVFDKFSSSISNVYNLTYIRNQQVVNVNDPLKLKFVIKAVPK